jgi:hypothetical protein
MIADAIADGITHNIAEGITQSSVVTADPIADGITSSIADDISHVIADDIFHVIADAAMAGCPQWQSSSPTTWLSANNAPNTNVEY